MENLSSALTFVFKFIFPGIWSAGFGMGTLAAFLGEGPVVADRWVFLAFWLGGSAFLWWGVGRLKRVRLDGATLVISNYRREVRVSASEIAHVDQNIRLSWRPVRITFARETPFGRSIVFMPEPTFSLKKVFSEDDVVGRLCDLAISARGRALDPSSGVPYG